MEKTQELDTLFPHIKITSQAVGMVFKPVPHRGGGNAYTGRTAQLTDLQVRQAEEELARRAKVGSV